jgi:tetratricopeptide (TPR) repeat protein
MLGVIYSHNNQFKKAIDHFRRALSINPQYTEAQLNLAIVLADTGSYDQAQSEFGRVWAREKESAFELSLGVRTRLANTHIEQGKVYKELGLHEEAIEEYRKAIRLCPSFPDFHNRLGATYQEKGMFIEAEAAFREALRINPRYADAYASLGLLLFHKGEVESAIRNWEEALRINPQHKAAQVYLKLAKAHGTSDRASPEKGG